MIFPNEIENLLNILQRNYDCKLLRISYEENGDIDLYKEQINDEKLIKFLLRNGFTIIVRNKSYIEFVKYINKRLISLEIANTLFRSSKFNIELKYNFKQMYIENPKENDIWLKSLRYLLSFRRDKKAKEFFYKNKKVLEKNSFFIDRLEKNPFKCINLDLFFKNKYLFIIKCVKKEFIVDLILNKLSFFKRKNRLLAIVGVDGAGKSTIIEEINKFFYSKTIYCGGRGFKFENFYNSFLKVKILIPFIRFFQYIENIKRALDALYNANIKKKLVICDRYPPLEYYISNNKKMKIFYYIFYKYFFIKPKIIFISGNAEEIYKRKQELSIEEIEKEQDKIRNSPYKIVEIENKNGKLEDTINKTIREIYKDLNNV